MNFILGLIVGLLLSRYGKQGWEQIEELIDRYIHRKPYKSLRDGRIETDLKCIKHTDRKATYDSYRLCCDVCQEMYLTDYLHRHVSYEELLTARIFNLHTVWLDHPSSPNMRDEMIGEIKRLTEEQYGLKSLPPMPAEEKKEKE